MAREKKLKRHNQLFVRMYLGYACVLAIAALLIGIFFMNMYQNAINRDYYDQMSRQAKTITDRLKQYINNEEYTEALDYVDQWGQFDSNYDLMVISNPKASQPMSSEMRQ